MEIKDGERDKKKEKQKGKTNAKPLFPTCLFGCGVFFSAAKREEMEVTRAAFGRAKD